MDFSVSYLDRIFGKLAGFSPDTLAGGAVEFPVMMPAGENAAIESGVGERFVRMWAHTLQGDELTAPRPDQQHQGAVDGGYIVFSFTQFAQIARFGEHDELLQGIVVEYWPSI
ncbi:hypothetical protein PG2T_00385 [Immundisolibacter cernigliae]|uniref:Uncharacterized protein n=1 Tax=Immundisolibacter cernigliae TaxID=1810504 RepID=A0A1B1YPV7_9GAMM|nr:hypothetical protein PG2T_00385 [Immundisolibacter cernigliae]